MKFLVLGAGRLGYAVTYDLIRSPKAEKVILADKDASRVEAVENMLSNSKIVPIELDVTDLEYVSDLMKSSDVTVSCVPAELNYELAKTALHSKSHFCDMGDLPAVAKKEYMLDEVAKEQGITIIPELGLAPGLVSILATAAAASLDELYEIRIRVGSLPAEPDETLLNCGHVNCIETLLRTYSEECSIIRDGEYIKVPPLSGLEEIEFPKPLGQLEAFSTSGGITTLPKTMYGRLKHLDFKTIQYPGHCQQIRLIKELGLLDTEKISLSTGAEVVPQTVLLSQLNSKLSGDVADVALLRITVTGVKDRKPLQCVWNLVDYGDEAGKLSATSKLAGYTASIIAQMIARDDITDRGVLCQEESVPAKLLLAELASRGISLTMTERAPIHNS
ncbi:MAG: saccharopine dehydrogenase NADP-binding domain-containing protein [Cyanobacteria bacterium]|nr:saccharopine dehydrogenase NADP-binding domain-containing protein [Cyanobacteriota bacterium]